jgi:hypothetical protein
MYMSTFIDDTEKEDDNQVIKKMKVDTDTLQQPSNPFMGLSLINPDEIEENLLLYKPRHKIGEKFIMNDTEYTIRNIIMDYDKNKEIQLYKYVFVPSSRGQSYHNYKDTAYDIDRMIDMKPIRERKGQPLGGKYKSRRRRKSRKSRKHRKSKKSRK